MKTDRTALFLMANLGSEVSRLLSARERQDSSMTVASYERAEKMIEEIVSLPEMAGRTLELGLLKSVIVDFCQKQSIYKVDADELKQYFLPFVLRFSKSR